MFDPYDVSETGVAVRVDSTIQPLSAAKPEQVSSAIAVCFYAFAGSLGTLGMLGWIFDVELLRIVLPDAASMKFNTGLCLLLLLALTGIARVGQQPSVMRRLFVKLGADLVFLLSLLTALQTLFNLNIGIDQLFVADPETPVEAHPGRMSVATAGGFAILAVAEWSRSQHHHKLGQVLAGLAFFLSFLACAGYLLNREALYSFSVFSSMALHTALGILALAAGSLAMHSNRGLIALVYNLNYGGITARLLLPSVVLLPLLVSWLVIRGADWLAYDPEFGIILASVLSALLLMIAVYAVAYHLRALETENRRLETMEKLQAARLEQLQRSETMSLVAGGLAHDFNNLLLPIRWACELGQSGLKEGDPQLKLFRTINQAVDKANGLANRMMDLGKEERQAPEPLDLNDCIEHFMVMLKGVAKGRAKLKTELDPDLGTIVFVRQQLEQVLLNLVSNACHAIEARPEATPGSGEIILRTEALKLEPAQQAGQGLQAGDYARLSVTDNGTGMPENVRQRAMQPFFSTRKPGAGHGLGLATVKNIALEHHGDLEIDSTEGQGTTISMLFPIRVLALAQAVTQPESLAQDKAG